MTLLVAHYHNSHQHEPLSDSDIGFPSEDEDDESDSSTSSDSSGEAAIVDKEQQPRLVGLVRYASETPTTASDGDNEGGQDDEVGNKGEADDDDEEGSVDEDINAESRDAPWWLRTAPAPEVCPRHRYCVHTACMADGCSLREGQAVVLGTEQSHRMHESQSVLSFAYAYDHCKPADGGRESHDHRRCSGRQCSCTDAGWQIARILLTAAWGWGRVHERLALGLI